MGENPEAVGTLLFAIPDAKNIPIIVAAAYHITLRETSSEFLTSPPIRCLRMLVFPTLYPISMIYLLSLVLRSLIIHVELKNNNMQV